MVSSLVCVSSQVFAAEIVSALADQEEVAVTIYNDDLALVRDRRQVTLPQGAAALALREVSALIRPETAQLSSLSHPQGLTIFEQNFDFDLLTPDKLLEKYVGREVQTVRVHPQTGADQSETAQVLAAREGVVLKIGGRIETGEILFQGRNLAGPKTGNGRECAARGSARYFRMPAAP